MDIDSPLISILLDPMVCWDDFHLWLNAENVVATTNDTSNVPEVEEVPVLAIPSSVSARFSHTDLKLMRPEVGLAVINFLRDQVTTILDESPNNFTTPAKASKVSSSVTPVAKKFDYRSPVKSMEIKGRSAAFGGNKTKGGRIHGNKQLQRPSNLGLKRAQLFPGEKNVNSSLFGGDTKSSTLNEICQPNFNSAKVNAALEERFNGLQQVGCDAVAGVNFQQRGNDQRRRSLGPEFDKSSAPTGKGRRNALQMSLGDFIAPTAKTSRQKKKGKASAKFQESESKTRKAKSLSPTVVHRASAAVEDATGFDPVAFVTTPANQACPQPLAKVTEEYKAQFINSNVWSQIVREVQGDECQVSKSKPSIEVHSSMMRTSDDSLIPADPNLVTNQFELDK